ncbi:MAG: OpgC domain-containing protein [Rhizobiales bacterium]|nr:OpgC domain-containing protein [Hyphomicrobiales bacterium]
MPRQANAIDFWRGIALITIFINHVPGIYYARFTHANYSLSDSADLFVFLAGWSLRLMVGSPNRPPQSEWYIVLRLGGRAVQLYAVQIMITMIAIAMLAASATFLDNPLLLEWHNAAAVFYDPILTHIGLATLTHQLGYFDILPLYVVLMTVAPIFAIIDRYAPSWLLPLSIALYLATLIVPIPAPTWPIEGQWFFNPLAWQLVFVLGFVLAREDGVGGFVRRHIVLLRWLSVPIVAISAYIVWNRMWPDPTLAPHPRLLFIADKTYVTPMRLIQFLALIALFSGTYPYIKRWVSWFVNVCSMLGRNALIVFCVGSILSLAGQITRFVYRGDIVVDTLVVIVGISIMAFAAWLPEWREQVRSRPSAQPSPAS